ncbi:MAG: hypothetical protein Q9218_005684 [Villophora microphyllina]
MNIVEVVKHTYYVANFVYKAVKSAQIEDAERQQLSSDLGRELQFLASFQRYFEKAHGAIAYDQKLDQLWLLEIQRIVTQMKQDFFDYEKLEKKNAQGLLGTPNAPIPLLLAPNEINQPGKSIPIAEKASSIAQKIKNGQSRIYSATKWALFDRQRLVKVVEKFTKRNETLKEILQYAMAGMLQQIAQPIQGLKDLQEDQDAVTLGLTTWAEIKQIRDQPEDIDHDFLIKNCTVNATGATCELQLGYAYTRMNVSNRLEEGKVTKDAVLVEYKRHPEVPEGLSDTDMANIDAWIARRIDQLAKFLSAAGSNSLGTLPFRGYVEEAENRRHALLFNFPPDTIEANPISLHDMIESPALGRLWSLSNRFQLASDLAKIIGTFHMFDWIVKRFDSLSVRFCTLVGNESPELSKAYLTGFEYVRPVSGSTSGPMLDMNEQGALYRHPDLQAEPNIELSKIRDLYSLGVVLLEIGLWTTARQLVQQARPPKPSSLAQSKEEYIRKANSRLPLRMGTSYTQAVVACLRSRYKSEAVTPDIFLSVFNEEVIQKLSAERLLD